MLVKTIHAFFMLAEELKIQKNVNTLSEVAF